MLKFLLAAWLGGLVINVQAEPEPQSPPCNITQARLLFSLSELPSEVQALLGRSIEGSFGIADINEEFNSSDVISEPPIPMRRVVKGTVSDTCIRMTVEHGGRGYYTEQLEFHLTEHGWIKATTIRR